MTSNSGTRARWAFALAVVLVGVVGPVAGQAPPRPFGRQLTYDARGNATSRTDGNGVTTDFRYDEMDRLIGIEYADGTSVALGYDRLGRRTSAIDARGTTAYEYDIHDRLVRTVDPAGNAVSFRYDAAGRLAEVTYPDASVARYEWDATGRRLQVRDPSGGVTSYETDAAGNLLNRTLPNGVTSRFAYDGTGRVSGVRHLDATGSEILGVAYRYNRMGNPLEVTMTGAGRLPETIRYAFDGGSRLIEVAYPDETISYQYDVAGRLQRATSSDQGVTHFTYGAGAGPTLIDGPGGRQTLQYDGNGNLVEHQMPGRTIRYTWGHDNTLRRVEDGRRTTEYTYDVDGALVMKSVGGVTWEYVGADPASPGNRLAERRSGGELTRFSVGLDRYARSSVERGTQYFLTDGAGQVVGIVDGRGDLVATYSPDPFGQRRTELARASSGSSAVRLTRSPRGAFATDLQSAGSGTVDWAGEALPSSRPSHPGSTLARQIGLGLSTETAEILGHMRGETLVQYGKYLERVIPPFTNESAQRQFRFVKDIDPVGYSRYGREYGSALKSVPSVVGRSIIGGVALWDIKITADRYQAARREGAYREANMHLATPVLTHLATKWVLPRVATSVVGGATVGLTATGAAAVVGVGYSVERLARMTGLGLQIGATHVRRMGMDASSDRMLRRQVTAWRAEGWDEQRIRSSLAGLPGNRLDLYSAPPQGGPGGGGPGGPGGPFDFSSSAGGATGLGILTTPVVGGIELDAIARMFVDLNDVRGATVDPTTGQLVLVGKHDYSLPEHDLDDLVVAIRTVYAGQQPSMSIEPCRPGLQDGCLKVMYNGRFQHPDDPSRGWVRYDEHGRLVATDAPTTFGTHVGAMLYEADRYAKVASLGRDNLDPDVEFVTSVPGFVSELERMAMAQRSDGPGDDDGCLIRTDADRERPSSCHRIWFAASDIALHLADDGETLAFGSSAASEESLPIRTEARFVRFDQAGQMVDVPGTDVGVTDFVDHFNTHYADFGKEKRELSELVQFARLLAIVRWMKEQGVAIDLEWLEDYEVTPWETPTTTPGITAHAGSLELYGGVGFPVENSYVDGGFDDIALMDAALLQRPSTTESQWDVTIEDDTLQAMAISLAPSRVVGAFPVLRTDVFDPGDRGDLVFARTYSSADPTTGVLGKGWTPLLERVAFERVPASDDRRAYVARATVTTLDGTVELALGRDGTFHGEGASARGWTLGLVADDPYGLIAVPGVSVSTSLPQDTIHAMDGDRTKLRFGGFVARSPDGSVRSFDRLGRVRGIRSADGAETTFSYESGRLSEIRAGRGRWVRLSYNGADRLIEVTRSSGDPIHYGYDGLGRLSRVSGGWLGAEEYAYDASGRLSQIHDEEGALLVENAYDDRGRVVRSAGPDGRMTRMSYDDRVGEVNISDDRGRAVTVRLGADGRVERTASADGSGSTYEYDDAGRLTEILDGDGRRTSFAFDPSGELREVRLPDGSLRRYLGYERPGRPSVVIDEGERVERLTYDASGRITAIRSGGQLDELTDAGDLSYRWIAPRSIHIAYDDFGQIAEVRDETGAGARIRRDRDGRLVSVTTGDVSSEWSYDGEGRLARMVDEAGVVTALEYDEQSRVVAVTDGAGTARFAYADDGRVTVRTADGDDWAVMTDDAGRIVAQTDPTGRTTAFEYGEDGEVTAVLGSDGHGVRYGYDDAGRLVTTEGVIESPPLPVAPALAEAGRGSAASAWWAALMAGLVAVLVTIAYVAPSRSEQPLA